GALDQRPAQVLLADSAPCAAVDEQLHVAVPCGLRLGHMLAPPRARRVLDALLGRLPLADRGLRLALDPRDLVALLRSDEGDRAAGATDAAGAPDPVHVDLGVVGQ